MSVQKFGDKGGTQIFDVHSFARNKVFEKALPHGGAVQVFAAQIDLLLFFAEGHSADGAVFGSGNRNAVLRSLCQIDFYDFGNDVSAFFDSDGIANSHSEAFYLVKVVQGRPFDGCSGQPDGFKIGNRGDAPRSSDLKIDGMNLRVGAFGFEFIGESPACLLYTSPSPRDRG